jgi:hypothetical protein
MRNLSDQKLMWLSVVVMGGFALTFISILYIYPIQ